MNKRSEYISLSRDQTCSIAEEMAAGAATGDIYCLSGELGCGKTVFAKGFGKGLGVRAEITSPTFTIVNAYEASAQRLPFYHFDAYRIERLEAMDDTGYEEYFYGGGVCLIEWAERIQEIIPPGAVWIRIEKDFSQPEDFRRIISGGETF
ncbi:MAG: tRNA (adenosine(37)-N6)-threonylcarbamoyltransferase complex ATPase subunit type 1 TsaE [Clostridiales bacterium]|nr:tRNA (adenosine(37)-N6)-threonylcarbamoyltransferase complex ATPase subunit type 1 TsaE [Clostridiales bacterium]